MNSTSRFSTIGLAFLSLSIVACNPTAPVVEVDRASPEQVANAILEAFADQDWETLATYVSDKKVRFTPHTYVDMKNDNTLSQDEIANFAADGTMKTWGIQEGSGFPIDMTNMQYFERYVWDHDYRNADSVRWDTVQDYGSVIDNAPDVYPGSTIVEFHFDGFDPQYGGMDWRSLRLVLLHDEDVNFSLVGVIHDEWAP